MRRIRSKASLCDMCRNRDGDKMADLQDTWRRAGRAPFRHVWCKLTDMPEEERWHTCTGFEEMGAGR